MTNLDNNEANRPELIDKRILAQFSPVSRLSPNRLDELGEVCVVEHVSKDLDPTRLCEDAQEALYLIEGDLDIQYDNGRQLLLCGGTDAAKHPIDSEQLKIKSVAALTPVKVVRIDVDLLDIMLTWDQVSGYKPPETERNRFQKSIQLDSFNAFKLKNDVFKQLPAANIEALFERLMPIDVEAGEIIITQGQHGDYYYLVEQGTAIVSCIKNPAKPPIVLAEISDGEAFGGEALASDTKRSATVKMKTDGRLLRLKKEDFIELLKAPVVGSVTMQEAKQRVEKGAVWLDVRFESEFKYHHIEGAINVPVDELRSQISLLDEDKEYIAYCQTGRRSSAAVFIMAQFGLNAVLLEGGTRAN